MAEPNLTVSHEAEHVAEAPEGLAQNLAAAEAIVAREQEEIEAAQQRMMKAQAEAEATRAMIAAQEEVAAARATAAKAAEPALRASTSVPNLNQDLSKSSSTEPNQGFKPVEDGRRTRVPTPLPRVATLASYSSKRSLSGSASQQSLHAVRKSAPSFGFGTGTREQAGMISGQPERLLGASSPGPGAYMLQPSIGGKQAAARSPPVWRFNKADRFLYGYGKPDTKPGPEAYYIPSYVGGRQPDGSRPNTPMFSIAGRARPPVEAGLNSPGPAAYLLPRSVGGAQAEARKRGAPTWTIKGRDTISKGVEPEPGWESPGAIYDVPRGIGKQPDSAVRSEPVYTIASKARTPVEAGNDAPGPIYHLPTAIERQVDARKSSAPRPTFSRYSRWAAHEAELKRNSVPGPGHYG